MVYFIFTEESERLDRIPSDLNRKNSNRKEGMAMRFMHMADVHLGAAPDHGFVWAKDRGREIWESFRRAIADANEKKVDLLLIAGDLFHRQPELQELKEVNYLFSTLEKTVVVLMAGNHDYLKPSSPYVNFEWNENVICLFSSKCERIRLPELKVEVYGFSYYQQEITQPLYDGIRAEKNEYFKILLAHGGDGEHIPLKKERLLNAGFDYIALGHIHKPQVYIRNLAMYAGALEPIDCNDVGPHGYIIGDIHRKKVKLAFVDICSRQYCHDEVEVTEEDTVFSVREKIASVVRQNGAQHMYKITLKGQHHPKFRGDVREYMKCGRIVEVVDRTVPAFHLDALRRQYHGQLIGDFIDSFPAKDRNMIEEKALAYGLEALLYSKK